jgi:hypothetical protein
MGSYPWSRRNVPGSLHSFHHEGNHRGLPYRMVGCAAGSDDVFHAPSHHVALEMKSGCHILRGLPRERSGWGVIWFCVVLLASVLCANLVLVGRGFGQQEVPPLRSGMTDQVTTSGHERPRLRPFRSPLSPEGEGPGVRRKRGPQPGSAFTPRFHRRRYREKPDRRAQVPALRREGRDALSYDRLTQYDCSNQRFDSPSRKMVRSGPWVRRTRK